MSARRPAGGVGSNQYQTVGASRARPTSGQVARFTNSTAPAPVRIGLDDIHARALDISTELQGSEWASRDAGRIARRTLSPAFSDLYVRQVELAFVENPSMLAEGLATLEAVDRAWHERGCPEPAPKIGSSRLTVGWDADTVIKVAYAGDLSGHDLDLANADDYPWYFARTWREPTNELVIYQERVAVLSYAELSGLSAGQQQRIDAMYSVDLDGGQVGRRADGTLVCFDTE